MPLSDWFPHKKSPSAARRRDAGTAPKGRSPEGPNVDVRPVPDGIWAKCAACNKIIYQKELHTNLKLCPDCGHHYQLTSSERLEITVDPGSFTEFDASLSSADPLQFGGVKPYADTLERAKKRTGLNEAIITGAASIQGVPVVIGIMDFRFVAASMGSAVGEKITRAAERAVAERKPLLLFCASGGARMQEGMLSLMQMAKTSAAIGKMRESGVPYISVLTDPTTGGVSASFATLADVILAEPGALIGFAGPRVIEQTIRERLPKDFQRAEFLLAHGHIDQVVPRGELTGRLAILLSILSGATVLEDGAAIIGSRASEVELG